MSIAARPDRETPSATAAARGVAELRAITYLAPGVALEFFEEVVAEIRLRTGIRVRLESDARASGPPPDERDPFADDAVLGFMCGPSYAAAHARGTVRLVGVAPVFDDPRTGGGPRYLAEVLVREGDRAATVADLRGRRPGANDPESLSGWLALAMALAEIGEFPEPVWCGSIGAAVDALRLGRVDVASADSVALARMRRETPDRLAGTRVLAALGPFPAPPVVISTRAGAARALAIRAALAEAPHARFARFGCSGFAPVAHADYAELAGRIAACRAQAGAR